MRNDEKRVTLKVIEKQHAFIRKMSKPNDVTQEELLGLMIDVLAANPKAIEPYIERFRKRKIMDLQRKKDIETKAANLVSSLTPEMQEKLLSGALDLSKLEELL